MQEAFVKEQVVFNDVPDQAAEEDNVAAGTDWHPDIRQGARA